MVMWFSWPCKCLESSEVANRMIRFDSRVELPDKSIPALVGAHHTTQELVSATSVPD